MKDRLYPTASGCYDPTAGEALHRILREERKRQKIIPQHDKEPRPKATEEIKIATDKKRKNGGDSK